MQNKFQKDFEYAEYILEAAKQIPHTLLDPKLKNLNPKGKSLHQKLLDLYVEETGRQPLGKSLIYGSNLLQKLVRRDKLHCIALNLYPGNDGYSLLLRSRSGVETETIKLPYEECELLEYIDASELPPVLVDLLDRARVNVFYSGCVIVEVRDYRRSASGNIDSLYVLLRPTAQSLLADINSITSDGRRWSQEDQYHLESQLLLETEEPLCLDPSPAVFLIANKLQYERKKFNTPLLLRSVKKYSQAAVNRKRKFAHAPAPKELRLYDFLHRKKEKLRQQPLVNLKVGKANVDMWKQRQVQLSVPESVETERFAKSLEKPKPISDNIPVVAEEYTMEKEGSHGNCICYKITIYFRPSDYFYIGELYMDHDFKEGQNRGSSCRFNLGTMANAKKYVRELTEFFTEKGRLYAKITTTIPGQPPQVSTIQPQLATPTYQAPPTSSHSSGSQKTPSPSVTSQAENANSSSGGHKKLKPLQISTPLPSPVNIISPHTTPSLTSPVAITTTQLTNQMTINIQHPSSQSQSLSRHRHSSRPMKSPSPVSTASLSAQLPSYSQAIAGQPVSHKPSTTPTPPPLVKTTNIRRGSITDSFTTTIGSTLGTTTPVSSVTSSNSSSLSGSDGNLTSPITTLGQPNVAPNVNIANIPGLANINLQNLANLQGMSLANLQGLQNMQVSLTGVSVPGGGIAVPINMINTSPSLLQNQPGIIVSLPNHTSGGSTTTSSISTTSQINNPQVTSPTAYVTMVTAMPASSGTSTLTSTATSTAANAGVLTNASSVIAGTPHSMLQLPINVTGMTQFMPHLKTAVRGHAGLPLLQIPGQQSIQLLNIQQQQRLQAHLQQTSGSGGQGSGVTTTASPIPVSTAVLTGGSLGQTVTSLPLGKSGQTNALTAQQILQLTTAQPGTFQQLPRQFQFHAMPQQKPISKPKSKKPPKN